MGAGVRADLQLSRYGPTDGNLRGSSSRSASVNSGHASGGRLVLRGLGRFPSSESSSSRPLPSSSRQHQCRVGKSHSSTPSSRHSCNWRREECPVHCPSRNPLRLTRTVPPWPLPRPGCLTLACIQVRSAPPNEGSPRAWPCQKHRSLAAHYPVFSGSPIPAEVRRRWPLRQRRTVPSSISKGPRREPSGSTKSPAEQRKFVNGSGVSCRRPYRLAAATCASTRSAYWLTYDWDSLALVEEATALGQAAMTWSVTADPGGTEFPDRTSLGLRSRLPGSTGTETSLPGSTERHGQQPAHVLATRPAATHPLAVRGVARADQDAGRRRLAEIGVPRSKSDDLPPNSRASLKP